MATEPAPEVKEIVSLVRNRRTDSMFVVAVGIIVWLVYLVVYKSDINQFAQGVVTTVLGMFLRELGSMYSFETGTTRGGQSKDSAIARIAEQSAPTTAAAVAATVAAKAAETNGMPPIPVVPAAQPPAGTT